MERNLDKGEMPVKGKRYKFIGETNINYTKNKTYFCEKYKVLTNDLLEEIIPWSGDFSEFFVEVVEGYKTTERKLEKGEIPVKGKKYKRIVPTTPFYTEGKVYEGKGEGVLDDNVRGNHSWSSEGLFYDKFIEVIEEDKTEGVKHDQNKLPLFTIIFKQFPLAIQAVAKRALAGHNKYIETDSDWQNFARAGEQDPDRYKNAGMRHMLEEGEDKEEGMEGTTHESAVVWNFLADLECKLRRENVENI